MNGKKWISHAKEFINETSYLGGKNLINGENITKICINYNNWFISSDYRVKIQNN